MNDDKKYKQMQRLWRSSKNPNEITKKQQPTPIVQNNLLLPNQIGCRIIEIEMQVMQTQNLTKQIILDLLHEYSKAVEFYEERGSNKYLHYQRKMQNFLSKPAISQILRGKTGTMLIKKQKNEQQLKRVQTQSQVAAKKLLEDSKQSGQKQEDIIKKQLQNQQKNLEQRIQRKRAVSNRSTKGKEDSNEMIQVPQKTDEVQREEKIVISEFMQNPNPNSNVTTSNKKNLKVFI